MSDTGTEAAGIEPPPVAPRRWPVIGLLGVIAGAAAARAWIMWSTPMVPGMNGAYYLVQSRALLEHGRLGIPDFPLAFMLQALFAQIVHWVSGRGLEDCILVAVKIFDSVVPPLAAVPVFLLGRDWCRRANRGAWRAVLAAAVLVLGMPALSMVGDFQKNSLGLVWLACLVYALHAWMMERTRRRAWGVLLMLGLCGLTHIGVFGAALLLTGLVWSADLVMARRREGWRHLRHVAAVAAGGMAVVGVVAGLVLWKFDPDRIRRLAGALSDPVSFIQNGGHAPGQGPGVPGPGGPTRDGRGPDRARDGGFRPGGFAPGAAGPMDGPRRAPVGRVGGPGGGMPPMGPPGVMMPRWLQFTLFGLIAAGALVLPFRGRKNLPPADRAAAFGCAVCFVALVGPWMRGDITMRLMLIAMVPAAFAGLFALVHLPTRWLAPVCVAGMVFIVGSRTARALPHGGRPIISEDAFAELRTLTSKVTDPATTLVVARHGLEWWTAWTLHTRVAQARALETNDWTTYKTVLFIQEKGGRGPGQPRGFAPGMAGGPTAGFGAPPPGFDGPPPAGPFPGARMRGPARGPGGPGPMMEARIPSNAEILHDGTHFRLARVPEPPPALLRRMERMGGQPPSGLPWRPDGMPFPPDDPAFTPPARDTAPTPRDPGPSSEAQS